MLLTGCVSAWMTMIFAKMLTRTGLAFALPSMLCCPVMHAFPPAERYFDDPDVAALAEAAAKGDMCVIDRLLEKGVDVNAAGEDGITPLAYTLFSLNKSGFKKLLEAGADPNRVAEGIPIGGNVMAAVAQAEDIWWLRETVRHGGDVNVCGLRMKQTPIWHAMMAKRLENQKFLIENGANLSITDDRGVTPFVFALTVRNFESAMLLLENGAEWRIDEEKAPSSVRGAVTNLEGYTNNPGADRESREWQWRTRIIQILHEQGAEMPEDLLLSAGITPESE